MNIAWINGRFAIGNTTSIVWFHLIAILVVIIWGTTFISTKVLLLSGMTPADIFCYRFAMAYIAIAACSFPFKIFAASIKDELLFVFAGMFGGSLYFFTENSAILYTSISNVALLCSTTPLLTLLLLCFVFRKAHPTRNLYIGSLLAFLGVAMVIFNGNFVLDLNPWGDILCLSAAFSWSFYTILSQYLSKKYSSLFITRKTFFYGFLTILPMFLSHPLYLASDIFTRPVIWSNLLYLGLIASFLCFLLWNVCVRRLGPIITSNYIYLVPVVSLLTAFITFDETVTLIAIMGTALVLYGMWVAKSSKPIAKQARK